MANKQYGLILPKKQVTAPKLGNVFGDDNASDEDDGGTDWVRKALKAESEKNRMKKQTRLDMQKALDEDPTIYQYDEVYDDLERQSKGGQVDGASKQKEKKSKYIQKLLKTADRRKKEQEHRIERMVQKEREAEGEMYADKESFVTSAYRAKLEEFKKMEEEEAKMSRLEAIGDVTKQQDMSGFYRHLYRQTIDYKGETDENESNKVKEESTEQRKRKTSTSSTNGESATANETEERQRAIATRSKKSRQYRQRAIETYESDSETETSREELKKDQTTVASSADKEADEVEVREPEEKKQKINSKSNAIESIVDNKDKDTIVKNTEISRDDVTTENEETVENKKSVEKKDRSSIWEKRTVGPVFEAALQRYYARKAKRLAATN
ncbi:nuclear speckle splicing regulatory protein 1 [Monomorium pharaonis]|uniref:nuclear speckle splicing regulatory protein 1 n=1 Tax=Monomorium pharaonis TaxID=307658 RepID=UPI00063F3AFC|nr:nuclear speckle splicing regulatory protein 1 [Monomorium pharaonis]